MPQFPRPIKFQTPAMRVAQPVDYLGNGTIVRSTYKEGEFSIQGPDGQWLSPCQEGNPMNDQWAGAVLDQESFAPDPNLPNVLIIDRSRFEGGKSYTLVIFG